MKNSRNFIREFLAKKFRTIRKFLRACCIIAKKGKEREKEKKNEDRGVDEWEEKCLRIKRIKNRWRIIHARLKLVPPRPPD